MRNEEERIIDLSSIELSSLLPTFAPSPAESTTNAEFGPIALSGVVPGGVRVEALAALGIPALWLKRYPSGYAAIHDVLTNVIPPPPLATAAGGIIVFIGEKQSALRTARSVARALKQDPDECVLLSPSERPADHAGEHIMVIDELSARREQWANLDRTTIVAIDASFDRQDISWGRHVISVLRPILRWGVVDSTRKAEDIRWWARGLGGLHALAVTGVTSTATPAAVLQCGVPVARLDGQVATPAMWQKLLEQRLSDAVNRRAPDLITA